MKCTLISIVAKRLDCYQGLSVQGQGQGLKRKARPKKTTKRRTWVQRQGQRQGLKTNDRAKAMTKKLLSVLKMP